jgi:RNA polymerase sigma factor (TIGR02999 family)
MAGDSAANVTEVLDAVRTGRQGSAAALMGLVYDELRRLAHVQMAHVPPGATLEPTALVHEAYVRLVGRDSDEAWESRAHFFRTAARAMRDILVEQARRQASLKRGGCRSSRKRIQPARSWRCCATSPA